MWKGVPYLITIYLSVASCQESVLVLDMYCNAVLVLIMNQEEQLLTYKDAAEYLHVSIAQVYRYVKEPINPLPRIVLSPKIVRIRMRDLIAWTHGVFDNPNNDIADREGGEN